MNRCGPSTRASRAAPGKWRRGRRRGIGLLSMSMAVVLYAVFAVIALRLLGLAIHFPARAAALRDDTTRMDAAIERLREDVWNAGTVEVVKDGVTIETAGEGGSVAWRIGPNDALVRKPGAGDTQEWLSVGRGMTFEWTGSSLLVRRSATRERPDELYVLASQAAAAAPAGAGRTP